MSRLYRRTNTRALTFGLTPAQIKRVELAASGLVSEEQRNGLRVCVGAKLKVVAWGAVPDELLDRCIASALAEIGEAAA